MQPWISVIGGVTLCLGLACNSNSYAKSLQKDQINTDIKLSSRPSKFDADEYEVKEPDAFYGITNIEKVSRETLTSFGPTAINDSVISSEASVTGPLTTKDSVICELNLIGPLIAENLQLDSANIIGPVTLNSSKVTKKSSITGPLIAKDSTFSDIEITTSSVTLQDTVINKLVIHGDNNFKHDVQYVYMRGKSQIIDTVKFTSGNGVVVVNTNDPIRIANVIGGTVEQQDLS